MLKSQRGSPYFNPYYTVKVIHEGLFAGFIPVCPVFGFYQPKHYMAAFNLAQVKLPEIRGETVEDVLKITRDNSCELFGLKIKMSF